MVREPADPLVRLGASLDRGEQPEEAEVARALRSPHCPRRIVEQLTDDRRLLGSRRLLPLILSHPGCPRPFALDAMPRLGWRDLVTVARQPRTAPAIRRQAERRLVERLPRLTLGERRALARIAPRGLIAALRTDAEPTCVDALLENPRFTEVDALRLLVENEHAECLARLLRHRRWGRLPQIRHAALRARHLPTAVKLGFLATLDMGALGDVRDTGDLPKQLRDAAAKLVEHRRREG